MIILICYIIIGIIYAIFWWKTSFSLDYEEMKANGEVEDGAAIIALCCIALVWPVKLFFDVIKKIRQLIGQKKSIK